MTQPPHLSPSVRTCASIRTRTRTRCRVSALAVALAGVLASPAALAQVDTDAIACLLYTSRCV